MASDPGRLLKPRLRLSRSLSHDSGPDFPDVISPRLAFFPVLIPQPDSPIIPTHRTQARTAFSDSLGASHDSALFPTSLQPTTRLFSRTSLSHDLGLTVSRLTSATTHTAFFSRLHFSTDCLLPESLATIISFFPKLTFQPVIDLAFSQTQLGHDSPISPDSLSQRRPFPDSLSHDSPFSRLTQPETRLFPDSLSHGLAFSRLHSATTRLFPVTHQSADFAFSRLTQPRLRPFPTLTFSHDSPFPTHFSHDSPFPDSLSHDSPLPRLTQPNDSPLSRLTQPRLAFSRLTQPRLTLFPTHSATTRPFPDLTQPRLPFFPTHSATTRLFPTHSATTRLFPTHSATTRLPESLSTTRLFSRLTQPRLAFFPPSLSQTRLFPESLSHGLAFSRLTRHDSPFPTHSARSLFPTHSSHRLALSRLHSKPTTRLFPTHSPTTRPISRLHFSHGLAFSRPRLAHDVRPFGFLDSLSPTSPLLLENSTNQWEQGRQVAMLKSFQGLHTRMAERTRDGVRSLVRPPGHMGPMENEKDTYYGSVESEKEPNNYLRSPTNFLSPIEPESLRESAQGSKRPAVVNGKTSKEQADCHSCMTNS
ncbi:hypothetical protein C7M84_013780 [Penaeus vannamei]|uniref:Uncharacterized protein n=1 Tax=Penaeus vannamei TaxID=6689 RepID=A0A423SV56_PENVA|nr:hypothetical protein C7M84_013780 [Penaeus vannamei]